MKVYQVIEYKGEIDFCKFTRTVIGTFLEYKKALILKEQKGKESKENNEQCRKCLMCSNSKIRDKIECFNPTDSVIFNDSYNCKNYKEFSDLLSYKILSYNIID